MDSGIWATWYDLAEGDKETYLGWLHKDYLPEVLSRPGYLWAATYEVTGGGSHMNQIGGILARAEDGSVGTGTDYVTVVGAAHPHVFFSPNVIGIDNPLATPHPELSNGTVQDMFAKRIGARTNIFLEEARVNGPEIGSRAPGTTPGPAIQMGSFRGMSPEDDYDLGAWYAQYRLPHMTRMPGSIRTRKLLSVAGWAKHAVLYEFLSLDARKEGFEATHERLALDDKEWTNLIINYTRHSPGSPSVGRRIWPAVEDWETEYLSR
jgi:hypothetical protein